MQARQREFVIRAGMAVAVLGCAVLWGRPRLEAASSKHATGAAGIVGLDLYAQGSTVDVLLAAKTEAGVVLRHQRSSDGGASWRGAVTLPTGPRGLHAPHRGNDPQIAASGEHLIAAWTQPGTSSWGSGPLALALSADGGRTWSAGPNPADDGSSGGHGYLDLTADAAGTFYAAWLDARDGAQGLRAAVSRDSGRSWQPNRTLDDRTCECCWNRLASPRAGEAWVLFRDKDPRDMAVSASFDGGDSWSRRGAPGAFGWRFEGCPHVGGGLAFSGARLHALVWTGSEAHAGVHAASSSDAGATWDTGVSLGGASAQRPDLAAEGGVLAAVWDDRAEGAVFAATSADGARSWGAPRRLSEAGRRASHPLVVGVGAGRFVVAWTERAADGPLAWRSVRLEAD